MGTNEDKKKKKKNMDGDTITVLAILGGLILICVLLSWLTRNDASPELQKLAGNGNAADKEHISALPIVLTCSFVSLFFVLLFFLKKIRDRRRKEEEERQEKMRKLKELDEARERVQRAKMDAFLQAGQSEIEKRKKEERLLRSSGNKVRPYDREAYLRERRQIYEEEDVADTEGKKESLFQRILRMIKTLLSRKREEEKTEDADKRN